MAADAPLKTKGKKDAGLATAKTNDDGLGMGQEGG